MKMYSEYKMVLIIFMVFILSIFYAEMSDAAEKKDKSAKRAAIMVEKMKQDMQAQMDQEKATMQAQFDKQKAELEAKLKSKDDELAKLDSKLDGTERKSKSVESNLSKVSSEKASLETKQQQTQSKLEATQLQLKGLETKYAQAQADLKFNDNQRKTISSTQAETTRFLNTCEEKNTKLHQFGTELIQLYDKPERYEAAMRKEQFFQLKRVELENILQNYQDKLDAERLASKATANY